MLRLVELKGQITLEFLIVIIAFLFILTFALTVFSNNSALLAGFEENSEARVLAFRIGNALDEVFFAGNGASSVFIFVKTHDFNAGVNSGLLTLRSKNSVADFPLASKSVDFSAFEFNKKLKFSNLDGVVVVEKVVQ